MANPIPKATEEVLSTLDLSGNRKWIYPTPSHGRFWRARLVVGWVLIVFFVALPWIELKGRPAVFLDLARREFTFFGLTLHPTDTVILMVFLLTILVSIFFVTALFGRVWCGWACPQTVYLEFVYRPIERLIEGKESQRKRRDQGPWSWDKTWRKWAKLSIFAAISLFLAHTFVAYFAGWENLLHWMSRSPMEAPGYFFMMALTTGLILFDFGYFREQMCTLACPYARLQSVLMDEDSLIVSYDRSRGEKRGTYRERKKADKVLDLDDGEITFGDCIDCGACVRTCPTGIDIRDGLQMECVSCTQCVDACDYIMDSINKPRGLIRYTSENVIDGNKTRVARPRLFMYAALLLGLITIFVSLVATRAPLELDVHRASGTTYNITADDDLANRMSLRLRNRTAEPAELRLVPTSPQGAQVRIVGDQQPLLPPGEIVRFEAWITVPQDVLGPGAAIAEFDVLLDGEVVDTHSVRLLRPQNSP